MGLFDYILKRHQHDVPENVVGCKGCGQLPIVTWFTPLVAHLTCINPQCKNPQWTNPNYEEFITRTREQAIDEWNQLNKMDKDLKK